MSLHPWIADRFILSHHDNTLFVLDPEEGNIVGVLSLKSSISALATSHGHLFVLGRGGSSGAILRLSIHPSFVKTKPSPFLNVRRFVGNLSTASSRSNSREALDQLHVTERSEGRLSPIMSKVRQKNDHPPADKREVSNGDEIKMKPSDSRVVTEKSSSDVKVENTTPHTSLPEVVGKAGEDVVKDGVASRKVVEKKVETVAEDAVGESTKESEKCEEDGGRHLTEEVVDVKSDETLHGGESDLVPKGGEQHNEVEDQPEKMDSDTTQLFPRPDSKLEGSSSIASSQSTTETALTSQPESESSANKELEAEKDSSSVSEPSKGKSLIPTLALVHGISHVKADLKEITGVLKLGKLTEFISQATSSSPTMQRKSEQTSFSVSSGSNEVVRLSTEPVSCDKDAPPLSSATPTVTIDPEEQKRRLRLAEMAEQEEDIVVVTKSPSKARKTRKRKTKKTSKHSSATSESQVHCTCKVCVIVSCFVYTS